MQSPLDLALGEPASAGHSQGVGFDPSALMADPDGGDHKGKSKGASAKIPSSFGKITGSAGKAEKPRLSVEEVKARQTLVLHISRYLNHPEFHGHLEELGFKPGSKGNPPLQQLDKEELEELLERIKLSIRNVGGGGMLGVVVMGGVGFAESFTQRPGIVERCDLKGWSSQLNGDPMFKRALAEMEIEYNMMSNLSPEMRLAMAMGTSAIAVSQINKFHRAMLLEKGMQSQPVDVPSMPSSVEENAAEEGPAEQQPVFEFSLPPPVVRKDDRKDQDKSPTPVPSSDTPREYPEGKRKPGRPRKRDYTQLLGLGQGNPKDDQEDASASQKAKKARKQNDLATGDHGDQSQESRGSPGTGPEQ